jgi:8-oxo-dGTP pyrophosphatase MutT (NUDIX family)
VLPDIKQHQYFHYEKSDQLQKQVSKFLNNSEPGILVLLHCDLKLLFNDFKNLFNFITAAGGLVKNSKGQYLLIFRHNKWDLPKGKAHEDETPDITAIREVEEETGLKKLRIVRPLIETYHCYILKDNPVLKKIYWYEMYYDGEGNPIPQAGENITEALWMYSHELETVFKNTFPSIIEVFDYLNIGKNFIVGR